MEEERKTRLVSAVETLETVHPGQRLTMRNPVSELRGFYARRRPRGDDISVFMLGPVTVISVTLDVHGEEHVLMMSSTGNLGWRGRFWVEGLMKEVP